MSGIGILKTEAATPMGMNSKEVSIDQIKFSNYDYLSSPHSLERLRKYNHVKPFERIEKLQKEEEVKHTKHERQKYIKKLVAKRQEPLMVSEAQLLIRTVESGANSFAQNDLSNIRAKLRKL